MPEFEHIVGVFKLSANYKMDEEAQSIFKEIAEFGVVNYNMLDPLRKLKGLAFIVDMVYELNIFKSQVSGLLEKQQELQKETDEMEKER